MMAITVSTDSSDGLDPSFEPTLAASLRRLIARGQDFRRDRATELQLGSTDLTALGHLFREGPMAPGKLSDLMHVTSGTMTALLDRVEKAGFLKRERNPSDRRSLLVGLTPAGRHAVQWLDEQFAEVIRAALERVPELDAEQFRTVLDLLSTSLADAVDQGSGASSEPAAPPQVVRLHKR